MAIDPSRLHNFESSPASWVMKRSRSNRRKPTTVDEPYPSILPGEVLSDFRKRVGKHHDFEKMEKEGGGGSRKKKTGVVVRIKRRRSVWELRAIDVNEEIKRVERELGEASRPRVSTKSPNKETAGAPLKKRMDKKANKNANAAKKMKMEKPGGSAIIIKGGEKEKVTTGKGKEKMEEKEKKGSTGGDGKDKEKVTGKGKEKKKEIIRIKEEKKGSTGGDGKYKEEMAAEKKGKENGAADAKGKDKIQDKAAGVPQVEEKESSGDVLDKEEEKADKGNEKKEKENQNGAADKKKMDEEISGGGGGQEDKGKGIEEVEKKKVGAGEKRKKLSITIPLTKQEIEDDIIALTGAMPDTHPKKRPRNLQIALNLIFPALYLTSISPDTYKPNGPSKKRKRRF